MAIASPQRAMVGPWRAGWLAVVSLALLAATLAAIPARAHPHPPSTPPSLALAMPAAVEGVPRARPMAKAWAGAKCLVPCLNHGLGVGAPTTGGLPSPSARAAAGFAGRAGDSPGRDPPPEPRPPMTDAGARPARDRA